MRKAFCLAGLLAFGTVSAAAVDYGLVFRQLVGNNNVKARPDLLDDSIYTVSLPLTGGKSYPIEIESPAPKYVEIALGGETQSVAQKQAVAKFAANLAVRCFNILPARQTAITAWISSQLNLREKSVQMFGPLTISLNQTTREPYVILARSAPQPGQAPWINYCN